MSAAATDSRSIERARNAVLTVFAVCGFVFASWASRLPDVRARLDLTPGRLSLLLLAIAAGSVVGLPLAGRVNHRVGPANAVRVGAVLALPGVAAAGITVQARGSIAFAAIGLLFMGFGIGIWDVSQNFEGTRVEQASGRSIMPWFHAAYSLGTVLGALVGALVTYLAVPIGVHTGVAAGLGLLAVLFSASQFSDPEAAADSDELSHGSTSTQRSAWLEPQTLLIGLMILAAAFAEGSANDWMAVAFVDGHHVSEALGVVAFAVFLSFMTMGRVLGTRLLDRHGRVPILRILFAMAIAGCVLVVFGYVWLAFIGAAVWGLGASLGFPVGMSAAADDPRRAATRLATVSTIGYLAFLSGPPLLGFLGDHHGILRALLVVGGVSALAILIAPAAQEPATRQQMPTGPIRTRGSGGDPHCSDT